MKVLVTGAAGFIGPHVAAAFEERGHEVARTDILVVKDSRIEPSDLTSLESMLQVTAGVDVVCHLGGVGDVYLALNEPHTAAAANVLGTANLLEACLRNGVHKVIYASTWEVYGEPQYQPIDEEHPCNPDHPYSITKLAAERLMMAYDRLKGLPGMALRLGTAYGPGMRPNSVFSIFISRAMQRQPITIKGTGQQSRQFTHVADIARAFILAAEGEVWGEVFNIVADENITIQHLAELVVAHVPTNITYEEARVGDVPPAKVSSEKAKRVLEWYNHVRFGDGLLRLIEWHRSMLKT
jgi:nucleoside-diphosphate-sugar epimerase